MLFGRAQPNTGIGAMCWINCFILVGDGLGAFVVNCSNMGCCAHQLQCSAGKWRWRETHFWFVNSNSVIVISSFRFQGQDNRLGQHGGEHSRSSSTSSGAGFTNPDGRRRTSEHYRCNLVYHVCYKLYRATDNYRVLLSALSCSTKV